MAEWKSSDESSKRAIMRTDAHLPVSRNRFDRLTPAERFHDESARNREIKRSRYAVPDYSACQGESCLAASRIRTASRKGHVVDRRQWRVAPFEIRSARRKLNRLNVDRARREQIQAPVVVMDFMYRTSYGGVWKFRTFSMVRHAIGAGAAIRMNWGQTSMQRSFRREKASA
ncbi:hypothetical protein [Burkholderia reimsis]|uniref:hypothetical protein n=1 Tax=Burkholderia reimsis TaxID=2234132 RepID=UPI00105907F3|nr:hypothetical protein [Burkholderia reimsis]